MRIGTAACRILLCAWSHVLTCVMVSRRPDAKNAQYQAAIKQGDLILNRLQKLSRVVDMD